MPSYPDLSTHGSSLSSFFKLESAGGITLMLAAVFAMILANSPYQNYYDLLKSTPVKFESALCI